MDHSAGFLESVCPDFNPCQINAVVTLHRMRLTQNNTTVTCYSRTPDFLCKSQPGCGEPVQDLSNSIQNPRGE